MSNCTGLIANVRRRHQTSFQGRPISRRIKTINAIVYTTKRLKTKVKKQLNGTCWRNNFRMAGLWTAVTLPYRRPHFWFYYISTWTPAPVVWTVRLKRAKNEKKICIQTAAMAPPSLRSSMCTGFCAHLLVSFVVLEQFILPDQRGEREASHLVYSLLCV